MRKFSFPKIKKPKRILNFMCFMLLAAIIVFAPLTASKIGKTSAQKNDEMAVLNIWQIDNFEGGKGSRAEYLKNVGAQFTKTSACYVKVTALTSAAARENLKAGNVPELISYGAGTHGIESYFTGKSPYYCWCNGGYCFLSVDESADFSDICRENTVINSGNDNFSGAAALLCGVNGADTEKPTGAYVKLINGKYKYLLGTQRDIFRLKTRGISFKIEPITAFNDLYQNISITSKSAKLQLQAQKFIDFLLEKSAEVKKVGLMADGMDLYDDEMHAMERLEYECRLTSPISEQTRNEIEKAVANEDIKMLKNFLN